MPTTYGEQLKKSIQEKKDVTDKELQAQLGATTMWLPNPQFNLNDPTERQELLQLAQEAQTQGTKMDNAILLLETLNEFYKKEVFLQTPNNFNQMLKENIEKAKQASNVPLSPPQAVENFKATIEQLPSKFSAIADPKKDDAFKALQSIVSEAIKNQPNWPVLEKLAISNPNDGELPSAYYNRISEEIKKVLIVPIAPPLFMPTKKESSKPLPQTPIDIFKAKIEQLPNQFSAIEDPKKEGAFQALKELVTKAIAEEGNREGLEKLVISEPKDGELPSAYYERLTKEISQSLTVPIAPILSPSNIPNTDPNQQKRSSEQLSFTEDLSKGFAAMQKKLAAKRDEAESQKKASVSPPQGGKKGPSKLVSPPQAVENFRASIAQLPTKFSAITDSEKDAAFKALQELITKAIAEKQNWDGLAKLAISAPKEGELPSVYYNRLSKEINQALKVKIASPEPNMPTSPTKSGTKKKGRSFEDGNDSDTEDFDIDEQEDDVDEVQTLSSRLGDLNDQQRNLSRTMSSSSGHPPTTLKFISSKRPKEVQLVADNDHPSTTLKSRSTPASDQYDLSLDALKEKLEAASEKHAAGWQISEPKGNKLEITSEDGEHLGIAQKNGAEIEYALNKVGGNDAKVILEVSEHLEVNSTSMEDIHNLTTAAANFEPPKSLVLDKETLEFVQSKKDDPTYRDIVTKIEANVSKINQAHPELETQREGYKRK